MPENAVPQNQTARRFLFVLLLGSLLLVGAVIWPLAEALLMAAVLAVVLAPLQQGLTRKLRGGRQLSSGILVFAVLVLLIGPLIGLSAFALNEASAGVKFILETVRGEGMSGLIERLPGPLSRYATEGLARLGDLGKTIEAQISSHGGQAASAVGAALMATGSLLFQGTMMLIALFFLLARGDVLLSWMDSVSPLRRGQTRELLAQFQKVASAVIVSTLITAGVQALSSGLKNRDTRVRNSCAYALGNISDRSAVPYLVDAMKVALATSASEPSVSGALSGTPATPGCAPARGRFE